MLWISPQQIIFKKSIYSILQVSTFKWATLRRSG